MEIRQACESDISEIVEVLKASLGEDQLELSDTVWRYKHIDNPFGESIVLVAIENSKIIGVRAFMCWKWRMNDTIFNAYRAVDTATHPEHQGKGIFKKLTMAAIEIAAKRGDHFIFNTPNEKSRPGYLKMGWEIVDKVVIAIKPAFNSFLKIKSKKIKYSIDHQVSDEIINNVCNDWNERQLNKGKLFTPKSRYYLSWRYEKNPLQKYQVITTRNIYLAAYVKKRGRIKELRVAECLHNDNKEDKRQISRILLLLSSKFGVQVITYAPDLFDLWSIKLKGSFGPILTLKELNLNTKDKQDLLEINNWANSIGDLELF